MVLTYALIRTFEVPRSLFPYHCVATRNPVPMVPLTLTMILRVLYCDLGVVV